MRPIVCALGCLVLGLVLLASPALADLPDATTLLGDLGLGADEIAQVKAGQFVTVSMQPASERELVAALAFRVDVTPSALMAESKADLLDRVDPGMTSYGVVSGAASAADFQKLALTPDAAGRAKAYVTARPGEALNLSKEEIAGFAALDASASVASVEQQVRSALLARMRAYQSQGLAGIAPYARSEGERSAADELRTATAASANLRKYAPVAYRALADYPRSKPPGSEESFRWSQFDAHGTPTLALTHVLLVPDGDAWLVVQRQFYVSAGYNAEQAVAAFLPTQSGTVVVYGNRTSTDQITGFGGGMKREIGSSLLASQLRSMFERARAATR